jgi:hypothetical protein
MRRVTMATRVVAVQERYANGERREKTRILDEFVAVTGFHRKLVLIWEASDRICGKRLKPLMPLLTEAMERHGHLKLAPEIRSASRTASS